MANNDYVEIDKIKLDSNHELKFQKVTINSEKCFGDIRTFVDTQEYTGHTKKGIRFKLEQLKALKDITSTITITKENKEGLKIDQFQLSESSTIVIQIQNNKYTNYNPLIDIRTHVDSSDYIGFTKKGFRFPLECLEDFNNKLNKLIDELEKETNDSSTSTENSSMVSKIKDEMI